MRPIKRIYWCSLIVAFIGFPVLLFTWTLLNLYKDSTNMHDLDSEKSSRYDPVMLFGEIDSQNHSYCQLLRQRYPILDYSDGDMDIAYTLVVHKDIKQIARLLRMIYRRNNYYCIHMDKRSSESFEKALGGVAICFGSNVELVPKEKRIAVQWGDETVLAPQLICGEQALQRHSTWKYLINTVGQEFPLRTNLELIAALRALNGSNLVEGLLPGHFISRTKGKSLPLNATWIKGSIYGAFRREFMEVAVFGESVSPIRDLMLQPKTIEHPDEFYFNVLNFNPHLGLPGSCSVFPISLNENGYLGKFVIWSDFKQKCYTKYVRNVCILGNIHVEELKKAPHMFANKFHATYQPDAYDALEFWYFERVKRELETGSFDRNAFDPSIYANLTCSRFHI